jgi:3-oxoacyl-[acyl-carrier protein] reductase
MIDPRLAGKVVLITGANHGIGAATARAFASQGAKVFMTYYRAPSRFTDAELAAARQAGVGGPAYYHAMQQQSANVIVEQIHEQGGVAVAHEADLSDTSVVPMLYNRCEEELGPVDVLVNNHTVDQLETFDPASVTSEGFGVRLVDADGVDFHFAVNVRASVLMMTDYVDRYLQRQATWGRIINISTDAAHAHDINVSYAASKHAMESYSRSAAAELGKYSITVNIVAPGPIQTGYITPESEAEIAAGTPLGRVGRPEDVADVIVFIASEQAHWLTGQLLYVGGGWRMHQ